MQQPCIAAIATAPGNGGIGIVRLSGTNALNIATALCNKALLPRTAHLCTFSLNNNAIDEGIALSFPAPHSFTGEDVVELQGHGGSVVLNMLLQACITLGATQAKPGEFSERAFLNGRMDLIQAEAIADLIHASSEAGVRAAGRSLQGVFSEKITDLLTELIQLRVFIESAIDFPEEEIDFIKDSNCAQKLQMLQQSVAALLQESSKGMVIQEGIRIAIVGRPNAGKSSLLNALSRQDLAIVTPVAGTTRDNIEAQVLIQGVPFYFIDTAGLNESPDEIEKIGIDRSVNKAELADAILWLQDVNHSDTFKTKQLGNYAYIIHTAQQNNVPIINVANKIDIQQPAIKKTVKGIEYISAKTGEGLDQLQQKLMDLFNMNQSDPEFSARSRHVNSLKICLALITSALEQLADNYAGELIAEDLRLCQNKLSSITGEYGSDDLLGEIFSSFCIGK